MVDPSGSLHPQRRTLVQILFFICNDDKSGQPQPLATYLRSLSMVFRSRVGHLSYTLLSCYTVEYHMPTTMQHCCKIMPYYQGLRCVRQGGCIALYLWTLLPRLLRSLCRSRRRVDRVRSDYRIYPAKCFYRDLPQPARSNGYIP